MSSKKGTVRLNSNELKSILFIISLCTHPFLITMNGLRFLLQIHKEHLLEKVSPIIVKKSKYIVNDFSN